MGSAIEYIGKITEIIAQLTIVIGILSLVFRQWWYRAMSKIAIKDRFLECTARYARIQEMMLADDGLNHLSIRIYRMGMVLGAVKGEAANDDHENHGMDVRSEKVKGKELTLAGMMFQLMEDVWIFYRRELAKDKDLVSGWNGVFRCWMRLPEVREKWPIVKDHFGREFIAFVESNYLPEPLPPEPPPNVREKAA